MIEEEKATAIQQSASKTAGKLRNSAIPLDSDLSISNGVKYANL